MKMRRFSRSSRHPIVAITYFVLISCLALSCSKPQIHPKEVEGSHRDIRGDSEKTQTASSLVLQEYGADSGPTKDDLAANVAQTETTTLQKGEHTSEAVFLNSLIGRVKSSSMKYKKHPPSHAVDGFYRTAWNAPMGSDVTQWIEIQFEKPELVDRINLTTGWFKNNQWGESLFVLNARAKKVRIEFDDGNSQTKLSRETDPLLVFDNLNRRAKKIRVYFEELWPGEKWQDLAISEIEFWGTSVPASRPTNLCQFELHSENRFKSIIDVPDHYFIKAVIPSYDPQTGWISAIKQDGYIQVKNCRDQSIKEWSARDLKDGVFVLDEVRANVLQVQFLADKRVAVWIATGPFEQGEIYEDGFLALLHMEDGRLEVDSLGPWSSFCDGCNEGSWIHKLTQHQLNGRLVWTEPGGSTGTGGGGDSDTEKVWVEEGTKLIVAGAYDIYGYHWVDDIGEGLIRHFDTEVRWLGDRIIVEEQVLWQCKTDHEKIKDSAKTTYTYVYELKNNKLILQPTSPEKQPECDESYKLHWPKAN